MTTTYKIAEVAKRSGFNASTLRYYEELGLVTPTRRSDAGYRLYDDSTLARLTFIARAKQLGCSLEEITDLAAAWQDGRCQPVQLQLRALVDGKIAEAETRVAEMIAFTAELQQAAIALARHTPDGPCDDDCGCVSSGDAPNATTGLIQLTANPATVAEAPIVCTLGASDVPARGKAWHAALTAVISRESIDGGVRLQFAPETAVGDLAELAAAEQNCCMFFRFALTVDSRGVALEVTAPPKPVPSSPRCLVSRHESTSGQPTKCGADQRRRTGMRSLLRRAHPRRSRRYQPRRPSRHVGHWICRAGHRDHHSSGLATRAARATSKTRGRRQLGNLSRSDCRFPARKSVTGLATCGPRVSRRRARTTAEAPPRPAAIRGVDLP